MKAIIEIFLVKIGEYLADWICDCISQHCSSRKELESAFHQVTTEVNKLRKLVEISNHELETKNSEFIEIKKQKENYKSMYEEILENQKLQNKRIQAYQVETERLKQDKESKTQQIQQLKEDKENFINLLIHLGFLAKNQAANIHDQINQATKAITFNKPTPKVLLKSHAND